MRSIYAVIVKLVFRQSLIPVLIIECALIATLYLLNNYQTEKNKEALQKTTHETFEEIASKTALLINQQFETDKLSLAQLKETFAILYEHRQEIPIKSNEWHLVNGFYQYDAEARNRNGFLQLPRTETTAIYTTNIESLALEDYQILTTLSFLLPSIEATVASRQDLIASAWVNLGNRYALAYPSITPYEELTPDLDVTQYPFYFLADTEHNPDKKAIFIPLYHEPWALSAGELGAFLVPIYENDRFIGVIGLTLTANSVANIITSLELPFNAYAMLSDKNGKLIATSDPERTQKDFGVYSFYERHTVPELAEKANDTLPSSLNTPGNITFIQPLEGTDLQLIIRADKTDIFAMVERISQQMILAGSLVIGAIALFYLLFFWYNIRSIRKVAASIARPLQRIVSFSSKLGRDEGVALRKSSIKELQLLNSNLNETHQKLLDMVIKDDATGLYNRRKLITDLEELDGEASLMLLQLKNHKTLQNLYGHEAADKLIHGVVMQLLRPKEHRLYRTADDEFALLIGSKETACLTDIFKALGSIKIAFQSIDIHPHACAGVAVTNGSETPLIEQAGIALLFAQRNNSPEPILYADAHSIKEAFESNLEWSNRLTNALHEDRLVPYFQPIFNLHTNKIEKFESLVRMIEDDRVYSPGYFLQSAASMGRLHDITKLMVRKVFDVAALYPESAFSINISFKDFNDSQMLHFIQEESAVKGVSPSKITFELLETEAIENEALAINTIKALKDEGFSIAIDDFGTGHSNFAHLLMMRVDYIKIDGQFIKNLVKDPNSATITGTIAKFSEIMGAKTIAEFVADAQILKRVRQFNIDYAQGYAISEPVPEEKITMLLKKDFS